MTMFLGRRNYEGLTPRQIELCLLIWNELCTDKPRVLLIDEAHIDGSRTRFSQTHNVTFLGADVFPGIGQSANSRLSVLACLAHELSHAKRYENGYNRPLELPDMLIDEAEASLDAAFHVLLVRKDREDLIEDARDRLIEWLARQSSRGDEE